MEKFIITSDSTCDLPKETIEKYGILICPVSILLGDEDRKDTVDVTAEDVISFVNEKGILPKTSALSIDSYREFFTPLVKDGKKVIHFCISSKASSCYEHAVAAAKEINGVYVIDSYSLSSGQGIQILRAVDLLNSGKTIEETVKIINEEKYKVQISFVIDTLNFLHKGGRCSSVALVASKVLKIHPSIAISDGALTVKKKYVGSLTRALAQYVKDTAVEYKSYDNTRVFITHSPADIELVELVKDAVKSEFSFNEIIESRAGSTVTSHCGYNTIGIIFYTR